MPEAFKSLGDKGEMRYIQKGYTNYLHTYYVIACIYIDDFSSDA
jgi:hypothetical protein